MTIILFNFFLTLGLYKKIYGTEEHPSIANTLYSIAQQYSNLGDYKKALEEFQRILGMERKYNL